MSENCDTKTQTRMQMIVKKLRALKEKFIPLLQPNYRIIFVH